MFFCFKQHSTKRTSSGLEPANHRPSRSLLPQVATFHSGLNRLVSVASPDPCGPMPHGTWGLVMRNNFLSAFRHRQLLTGTSLWRWHGSVASRRVARRSEAHEAPVLLLHQLAVMGLSAGLAPASEASQATILLLD